MNFMDFFQLITTFWICFITFSSLFPNPSHFWKGPKSTPQLSSSLPCRPPWCSWRCWRWVSPESRNPMPWSSPWTQTEGTWPNMFEHLGNNRGFSSFSEHLRNTFPNPMDYDYHQLSCSSWTISPYLGGIHGFLRRTHLMMPNLWKEHAQLDICQHPILTESKIWTLFNDIIRTLSSNPWWSQRVPSDPITFLQLSEHSGAYLLHRAPNVQWSPRALTTPWRHCSVSRCDVGVSGSSMFIPPNHGAVYAHEQHNS